MTKGTLMFLFVSLIVIALGIALTAVVHQNIRLRQQIFQMQSGYADVCKALMNPTNRGISHEAALIRARIRAAAVSHWFN